VLQRPQKRARHHHAVPLPPPEPALVSTAAMFAAAAPPFVHLHGVLGAGALRRLQKLADLLEPTAVHDEAHSSFRFRSVRLTYGEAGREAAGRQVLPAGGPAADTVQGHWLFAPLARVACAANEQLRGVAVSHLTGAQLNYYSAGDHFAQMHVDEVGEQEARFNIVQQWEYT